MQDEGSAELSRFSQLSEKEVDWPSRQEICFNDACRLLDIKRLDIKHENEEYVYLYVCKAILKPITKIIGSH
jgi:hypothetical protein